MKMIILGMALGVLAWLDFKDKEIPLWICVLEIIVGLGFAFFERRELMSLLLACIPGGMAIVFSWISREAIGYGDGIVLVMLGCYLSLSQVLSIGLQAFGVAGVVAFILLVVFRKNGRYRIPFIPFLALLFGWECLMQLGEL